jgi:hypothetical protein
MQRVPDREPFPVRPGDPSPPGSRKSDIAARTTDRKTAARAASVQAEPDDDTSRATITDGGITVSLNITFGDDGRIERAYIPVRYREVDGARVATPWACHYHRYESVAGVRVPMAGSAVWLLPDGELTYWRGRLLDVSFAS